MVELQERPLPSNTLELALKATQPIVKEDIAALKTENRKTHTQILKLQAENLSYKNRLAAAQKELEKIHTSILSP